MLEVTKIDFSYTNMSNTIQTKLSLLFVISTITTLVYIMKINTVLANHMKDSATYEHEAIPAVRRAQIMHVVNGFASAACLTIFFSNAGRVCAGWHLASKADADLSSYLIKRSTFLAVIGSLGVLTTISFFTSGRKSLN